MFIKTLTLKKIGVKIYYNFYKFRDIYARFLINYLQIKKIKSEAKFQIFTHTHKQKKNYLNLKLVVVFYKYFLRIKKHC